VSFLYYVRVSLVILGDRSHVESRLEGNFETANLIWLCGTLIARVKVIETFLECLEIYPGKSHSQHERGIHGGYDVAETTNCILCVWFVIRRIYAQIRVIFPLPYFIIKSRSLYLSHEMSSKRVPLRTFQTSVPQLHVALK